MKTRSKDKMAFLGVHVPASLLEKIKRRADADDRTVSAYIRRQLTVLTENDDAEDLYNEGE